MSTKELTEKELDMLEEAAMLRARGRTWAQLAAELDIDGERLRKLVRKSGRVYWSLFEEAQWRASMESAARARAKLETLLESADERVALRAAQTLMADDRGHEKTAVLADRNAAIAGNAERKRRNAGSRRELREAEAALAAFRREALRNVSPWRAAYERQYGGGGGEGLGRLMEEVAGEGAAAAGPRGETFFKPSQTPEREELSP